MNKIIFSVLGGAALLFSGSSMAITVSWTPDSKENDCGDYFIDDSYTNNSFENCSIFVSDSGQTIQISPVIAKYDAELGTVDINKTLFPTIDGKEFTYGYDDPSGEDRSSGDWTYTPGNGDPGVRFWAAKAQTFTLFWDVSEEAYNDPTRCDLNNTFTLSCLSEARFVTKGFFEVPGDKNLSHITFYDSEDPVVVPVPAAGWLMASGLLGLASLRRRK